MSHVPNTSHALTTSTTDTISTISVVLELSGVCGGPIVTKTHQSTRSGGLGEPLQLRSGGRRGLQTRIRLGAAPQGDHLLIRAQLSNEFDGACCSSGPNFAPVEQQSSRAHERGGKRNVVNLSLAVRRHALLDVRAGMRR